MMKNTLLVVVSMFLWTVEGKEGVQSSLQDTMSGLSEVSSYITRVQDRWSRLTSIHNAKLGALHRRLAESDAAGAGQTCSWNGSICEVNSAWMKTVWPMDALESLGGYRAQLGSCEGQSSRLACLKAGDCAWYPGAGAEGTCRPTTGNGFFYGFQGDMDRNILATLIDHHDCGIVDAMLGMTPCSEAPKDSCTSVPGCFSGGTLPSDVPCQPHCQQTPDFFFHQGCESYQDAAATCSGEEGAEMFKCFARECPAIGPIVLLQLTCGALATNITGCEAEPGCSYHQMFGCQFDHTQLHVLVPQTCAQRSWMATDARCNKEYTTEAECDAQEDCEWEIHEECAYNGLIERHTGCWASQSVMLQAIVDTNCNNASALAFVRGIHAYEQCAAASAEEDCKAVNVDQPDCHPDQDLDGGNASDGNTSDGEVMDGDFVSATVHHSDFCSNVISLLFLLAMAFIPECKDFA